MEKKAQMTEITADFPKKKPTIAKKWPTVVKMAPKNVPQWLRIPKRAQNWEENSRK